MKTDQVSYQLLKNNYEMILEDLLFRTIAAWLDYWETLKRDHMLGRLLASGAHVDEKRA